MVSVLVARPAPAAGALDGPADYYSEGFGGAQRELTNDLTGTLVANVQFAQTHTVNPNGNLWVESDQTKSRYLPNVIGQREALVMVIPQVAVGSMTVIARVDGVERFRKTMDDPGRLPRPAGSNSVQYSREAWNAVIPWHAMVPGLSLEFVADGKTGTLQAGDIDWSAPSQFVLQNIKVGMLTAPPSESIDLINDPAKAAAEYFQTLPVSRFVNAQYLPVLLDRAIISDGTIHRLLSPDAGGVYSGDMRGDVAKSQISVGINLANTGYTSWDMTQNYTHVMKQTTAHYAQGRYINGVVRHGLSGGNGIGTLYEGHGNEFSHEIGHGFGLGHYPGAALTTDERWAYQHWDSGWGWMPLNNAMQSNLRWDDQLAGPFSFRSNAFGRDTMSGGDPNNPLSRYTHLTGYSARIAQNEMAQRAIPDLSFPSGYRQWNPVTDQFEDAGIEGPTLRQVGVPVTTLLGGYDPDSNTALIYDTFEGNYGNVFDLPTPPSGVPACWLEVRNGRGDTRTIDLLAQRKNQSTINQFHVNLEAGFLPTFAAIKCREGGSTRTLANRQFDGQRPAVPAAIIIGEERGFSAVSGATSLNRPNLSSPQPGTQSAYRFVSANGSEQLLDLAGSYTFSNLNSSLCLGVVGGNLLTTQQTCNNGDSQIWELEPAGGSAYRLRNKGSNRCLDIDSNETANGTRVHQYACGGGLQQLFHIVATNGAAYLRGLGSGKCVDVPNGSTQPGAGLQIYTCVDSANLRWGLTHVSGPAETGGGGNVQLIGVHTFSNLTSSLCLGVVNGQYPAKQQTCDGSDRQDWDMESVGGGAYRLRNKSSDWCLDVDGGGTANGTAVNHYNCSTSSNQQWHIVRANGAVYLRGVGSGKCVDVPNGSTQPGVSLQIYSCVDSNNLRWNATPIGGVTPTGPIGRVVLTAAHSDRCVTTGTSSLTQQTCGPYDRQIFTLEASGAGYVLRDHNNKCLEIPGGSYDDGALVGTWTCNGAAQQIVTRSGDSFIFSHSGKCMSVQGGYTDGGRTIQQRTCTGEDHQRFLTSAAPGIEATPTPTEPGGNRIVLTAAHSDRCVTTGTSSLTQQTCGPYDRQIFTLEASGAGYVLRDYNNKCLEIPGGSYDDGALVGTWACNGAAHQIVTRSGDSFIFSHSGKCMSVQGGYTDGGRTIQQRTCTGEDHQRFIASAAPAPTPVPTSTPVAPTATPIPTSTAVAPTATPIPTSTAVAPTATPIPTSTAVAPTPTPIPTSTAVAPTATPIPINTPVPATATPPTPGGPAALVDGVTVDALSGAAGSETFFTIDVPNDATGLSVVLSGVGDADLYLHPDVRPTESLWTCRPYLDGTTNEECTMNNPVAGTWHVMVRGWTAYDEASLTATILSAPPTGERTLANAEPVTGLGGIAGSETTFNIDVPVGVRTLTVELAGTGDADLYVNAGTVATTSRWDCRPYIDGSSDEICTINNPAAGDWHVMVHGWTAFSAGTLTATWTDAPVTVGVLESGVPSELISGAAGDETTFTIEVPTGTAQLLVEMTGTGDADLFTNFGAVSTASVWECRPYLDGTSNETCAIDNPEPGTWHLTARGWEAFSNTTITATLS